MAAAQQEVDALFSQFHLSDAAPAAAKPQKEAPQQSTQSGGWLYWLPTLPILPRPKKFETYDSESRMVLDTRDNFDGVRMDFTLQRASFQLGNMFQFASMKDPPSYSLVASNVSGPIFLQGKWSPSEQAVDARLLASKKFNENKRKTWELGLKVFAKASKKPGQSFASVEAELKAPLSTLDVKWHPGGGWESSFMQTITRQLSAGTFFFLIVYFTSLHFSFFALLLTKKQGVGGFTNLKQTQLTGVARYRLADQSIWTGSIATDSMLSTNYTVCSSRNKQKKQFSVEMRVFKPEGAESWQATTSAGYSYQFWRAQLKGRLDTNWRASMLLEEQIELSPGAIIGASFCADMDYLKDLYKVGVGLAVAL
ncbi:hypothetical protein QOT17_011191 [Balamuthia mandrillaris]